MHALPPPCLSPGWRTRGKSLALTTWKCSIRKRKSGAPLPLPPLSHAAS